MFLASGETTSKRKTHTTQLSVIIEICAKVLMEGLSGEELLIERLPWEVTGVRPGTMNGILPGRANN